MYSNNRTLNEKELFKSGINIGKDILCTMANTLFFVFIGEFITLIILFYGGNYSFGEIINSKVFSAELIKIIFIAIGSILVIPVTSYVVSHKLVIQNN